MPIDFIKPRFVAESAFTPNHDSGFQESFVAVDQVFGNGIRRLLPGSDHKQGFAHGPQTSQPSYRTSLDLPKNNVAGFLSNSQVIEELLSKFSKTFRQTIHSKDYHSSRSVSIDKHPHIPIARFYRANGPGKLAKVLHHKHLRQQINRRLLTMYNRLLISSFKINGALLTLLNIPILNRRKQQQRFFEWLEKEILKPTSGVPVLGFAARPDLHWDSGAPEVRVGDPQLQLIKYFSEENCDPNSCASSLLKLYRAQHQSESTKPSGFRRSKSGAELSKARPPLLLARGAEMNPRRRLLTAP
jgi:hypothetical protein